MQIQALKRLRQKLNDDQPVYGLWQTLESAAITDMAVALGLDWVVIDAEHGHLDCKEINEHIRAGLRSDTVEQVEQSLRDCRYPPEGVRGIGSERATVWGQ